MGLQSAMLTLAVVGGPKGALPSRLQSNNLRLGQADDGTIQERVMQGLLLVSIRTRESSTPRQFRPRMQLAAITFTTISIPIWSLSPSSTNKMDFELFFISIAADG